MSICMAATWYPRGELDRLVFQLPLLEEQYERIVIALVPSDDLQALKRVNSGEFNPHPKMSILMNDNRRNGRYMALKNALDTTAGFIHYIDLDRLLRWVETRPQEWRQMMKEIVKCDCIIFGRTVEAFDTHPQALKTTEIISNQVVSYFTEQEMDVSAGSKSFSRAAAQILVEHGTKDNSIATDAEWPILLKQSGFKLEYRRVAGLDWESADQYRSRAANEQEQRQAAANYDLDPAHWQRRVDIAGEIIRKAIEIGETKHAEIQSKIINNADFDFKAVFDVDDYLYFYREMLTDERTDSEVSTLVRLLELDAPMKILDLACGFGRHTNRLAALGHNMTGIDVTPGFLEIARQDAVQRNVEVTYLQGDMRSLAYQAEFDRIMLLFTAFGYFEDQVNLQVLVNIRNALRTGGLFIFDTLNRDMFLKDMRPFSVVEKDGNLMIDRQSFDSLSGKSYNQRIVFRDGVRKDKPFFVRLYNASEICSLFTQAGMELYNIYGGWDGREFTSEAHRMVVVARKP